MNTCSTRINNNKKVGKKENENEEAETNSIRDKSIR